MQNLKIINQKVNYSSDCLLIHLGAPAIANGLCTIYYYLNSLDIKTELLKIDPNSIKETLHSLYKFEKLRLIGISMHWHPQIAISIKLAEMIKILPNLRNAKIVIGGITASYFAEDLIKFPAVDYVIKGDGEVPLALLFKCITERIIQHSAVPNLYYKENSSIKKSRKTYSSGNEIITSSELQTIDEYFLFKETRYVLNPGRGCDKNCVYCGGSKQAFSKWGNRSPILRRTINGMKTSIEKLLQKDNPGLYIVNDHDGQCDIISDCLSNYDLSKFEFITVDAWGLPPFNNIKKFFENTNSNDKVSFCLEISPESGSEETRKRIKGFSFNNRELENFLDEYFSLFPNYQIFLFFSYFLPYSDKDNLITRKYICTLTCKYFSQICRNKLLIFFFPLSTDPGSALQQGKIKDMKSDIKIFNNFYIELLSTIYNTGNFLHHFPSTMDTEEFRYTHQLFRFENIIRQLHPKQVLKK